MHLKRVLFWLYPLFAFLLPLQTRWIVRDAPVVDSIWEYGRVSVYGFDVVLIFINLIICWFIIRERHIGRGVLQCARTVGIIAALVVYELLVSLEPILTAVVLGRVALMVFAGWFLLRLDSIVLRRTLAAFVMSMVLSAGLGAAQFFTQSSLVSSKWLGLSWQEPSVLGTSVVEAAGGRWLRAHGTMPHPNALGGFAAIALIVFLTLVATHAESPRSRTFGSLRGRRGMDVLNGAETATNRLLDFFKKIFLICTPIILLVGIVTAVSRAAILATVAGGIALAWQAHEDDRFKAIMPWLKGMAIAGLLVILLAGPVAFTRLTAHGRLEALSFTKRITAFEEAWTTMRAYGLQGTGLGASTVALRNIYTELPIWEVQPVHNVAVLLVAELGAGGLILFCVGIWLIKKNLESRSWNLGLARSFLDSRFQILYSPLLICWLVLIMLDHYLWTLPAGLYLTGLMGWVMAGIDKKTRAY